MIILLKEREDAFNGFKSNLLPIISDTTPCATRRKTTISEDSFINEVTIDEKAVNSEIFN